MKIIWNKVTWVSQVVAIVLALVIFAIAFQLGRKFESQFILGTPVNSVVFNCAEGKQIHADFYKHSVHLEFGWQKTIYLPQTISASGARYANDDESMVFWNKGNTAFMTEGATTTYKDCAI